MLLLVDSKCCIQRCHCSYFRKIPDVGTENGFMIRTEARNNRWLLKSDDITILSLVTNWCQREAHRKELTTSCEEFEYEIYFSRH